MIRGKTLFIPQCFLSVMGILSDVPYLELGFISHVGCQLGIQNAPFKVEGLWWVGKGAHPPSPGVIK